MGKSSRILILVFCILLCSCKDYQTENYPYAIIGETITLTGNEWNSLWKADVAQLSLYAIEPNGNKVFFVEEVDYEVSGNKIRRTPNSRIVDFKNHKVIFKSDGTFSWASEPNRNPELTLTYQVYADYKYAEQAYNVIPSDKMSKALKAKITSSSSIRLVAIGTSITYGSHTFEHYYNNSDKQTYYVLAAKAISKLYNIESFTINSSIDGGGVNQLLDMQYILDQHPDVVIIELQRELIERFDLGSSMFFCCLNEQ